MNFTSSKPFRNRYGVTYVIDKVGEDIYSLVGDGNEEYWRIGSNEEYPDSIAFVDPSGGPFISLEDSIDSKPIISIFFNDLQVNFKVSNDE